MAMRPLGFGRPAAPQPEGDWEAYNAVSQAGQARVVGAIEDRYRAVAGLAAPRAARAPQMAQVGYNPRTGKYVVGAEEFDADDPAVIKMFAELEDLPAMPLATGLEGRSLDELKARWQDLYNNAEVDNSLGSIGRGMLEGIAGIPRGIASVFGADVANPYEGGADAWRRDNTTLYEQVGRTMRPTESLVGLGQAGIQAIESGLPVLAAGAAGTAVAGPGGGIAAGAAVAGGMAAESQGDEAQARLMQQFARMAPEDFTSNPEYMTLRRAGNDHPTAVDELVRRGRVSAARGGFAIGGISGALAPAASRFAGRALGLGGAAGSRADDAIGDAMLRMMRGGSTGLTATARGAGGSAMVGGTVEGGQEYFETDISQGLADVSAGQSDRYRMGQYGTADDFVGGFVGGAPFGALGGLRTPPAAPSPQPRAEQGGTQDPTLNAAMAGVVAPPAPDTSGAMGGNRQMVPQPGGPTGPSGGGLRPLGTNWTGGPTGAPAQGEEIVDGEFTEVPRQLPAPGMRALPPPQRQLGSRMDDQRAEAEALEVERVQLQAMLDSYTQSGVPVPPNVADGVGARLAEIDQIQSQMIMPQVDLPPERPMPQQQQLVDGLDSSFAQNADPRSPQGEPAPAAPTQPGMFGPAGGVTQAGRRNDTLKESQRDIAAQITAMLDPAAEKDSVWVPFGTRMPDVTLPDNVQVVPTPVGTFLTTEMPKARALRRNPKQAENADFMSQLLGYTAGKSEVAAAGTPPVALEATTPDGAVADSELTTQAAAPVAAQNMQRRVGKTAKVAATTPEAALAGRTARVEAEAAPKAEPTPARPPNPDQAAGAVSVEVAPGRPPEERRQIITEMLAPLQRKIQSKTTSKSEKAKAQAEADQLLAQLDAIEAPAATPQTGGRGPSKGPDRQPSTEEAGRDRTSDTEGRSPEDEAEAVFAREEANAQAARDLAEALEAERRDDEPLDLDVAPTAAPPDLRVDGVDAPVLKAAEMTVEVEDGEAQVKPSAMLDWYRKRIENLNRLLACVLK